MLLATILFFAAGLTVVFAVGSLGRRQYNETAKACEVAARTTGGWVCGTLQKDINGGVYASYLNVPYARQPLRKLRFQELRPPKPWSYLHDSTRVGPICPQVDFEYGPMMTNSDMSEACIHANVYVPQSRKRPPEGFPILVFVHGGGFASGSGDPDIYGPEYLMPEGIIVMTFNFRINVFGFITTFTSGIPGNNGLRDTLTFLNWVKKNARSFEGDPDDVTLGGHSTGACIAHLLVLSKAAEGLFRRAILLSGVAVHSLYTPSRKNAKEVAKAFASTLDIDYIDPEEVNKKLVATPIDTLMIALNEFQTQNFPNIFVPVVEKSFANITTVIGRDPEKLLLEGKGKNIPLLIGITDKEAKFLVKVFEEVDILTKLKNNPLDMISPDLAHRVPQPKALQYAYETEAQYFMGEATVGKFALCYGDYAFRYPAITLQRLKQKNRKVEAPTFLYEFSYNLSFSVVKETKHIHYNGAAHYDDLSLIFRTNSMRGKPGFEYPSASDVAVRQQMVKMIRNFIYCDDPRCSLYRDIPTPGVQYLDISTPSGITYSHLKQYEVGMVNYYDSLWKDANGIRW